MRRNGGFEAIGIDDFQRQRQVAGGADILDILVAPGGIGAGSDRLEAGGFQAQLAGAVEQGAGDEGLADFGIGAGEEISLFHGWAVRVITS